MIAPFAGIGLGITITFEQAGFDASALLNADQTRQVAETGLAFLKRRITQQGLRADGSPMKRYSSKPASFPTAGIGTGFPLLRPVGGKRSKSGKSMFFPGGYAEMRRKAGRSDKPDATISGNTLGRRFRVIRAGDGIAVVGWPAGSTQAVVAAGLNARENGQLFEWSKQEKQAMEQAAAYFVQLAFHGQGWAEKPPEPDFKGDS